MKKRDKDICVCIYIYIYIYIYMICMNINIESERHVREGRNPLLFRQRETYHGPGPGV